MQKETSAEETEERKHSRSRAPTEREASHGDSSEFETESNDIIRVVEWRVRGVNWWGNNSYRFNLNVLHRFKVKWLFDQQNMNESKGTIGWIKQTLCINNTSLNPGNGKSISYDNVDFVGT